MKALVPSERVIEALGQTGLLADDGSVRRVVIDLKAGKVPVIHIERIGDEHLLTLVRSLDGIEICHEVAR